MLRSDGAYVQFDWHFGFHFLESMTAKLESVNQSSESGFLVCLRLPIFL